MRFFVYTFGCQMNEHDSERTAGLLTYHGYTPADELLEADLIILNTCSVRPKAEDKVVSFIGRLAAWKRDDSRRILGVVGCMAQSRGEELLRRFEFVDFVVGPRSTQHLPEVLANIIAGQGQQQVLNLEEAPAYPRPRRQDKVTASVTIMEGCDNFCSYCIVPYVRGRERSRPSQEVLDEVRELAAAGYREIILLGQNVNSYHRYNPHDLSFSRLLAAINGMPGIQRIRFVTSHPRDFTADIVSCFRELDNVCGFLHLPVQSGANRILGLMNRGYTRERYLELIQALREARPGMAFSTDIIVGYPGETEEEFLLTLDLLRRVEFENVFVFRFAARPHTAAAELPDSVPLSIKRERLLRVMELQRGMTLARNRALIGTTVEILVTGYARRTPDLLIGRTISNRVVHFRGAETLIGHMATVAIEDATPNCLYGSLAGLSRSAAVSR